MELRRDGGWSRVASWHIEPQLECGDAVAVLAAAPGTMLFTFNYMAAIPAGCDWRAFAFTFVVQGRAISNGDNTPPTAAAVRRAAGGGGNFAGTCFQTVTLTGTALLKCKGEVIFQGLPSHCDAAYTITRSLLPHGYADTGGSSRDALHVLFVASLDYGRNRPLLRRMLSGDSQLHLSTQGDAWGRALAALRDLVQGLLRSGVERGEIRADLPVEHMADLLTEVHLSFANRQILTGNPVGVDAAEALATCMIEGVLPRATPPTGG